MKLLASVMENKSTYWHFGGLAHLLSLASINQA